MEQPLIASVQTPRLECLGFQVGDLTLPCFKLHVGQALCLHVEQSNIPWYETLLPLLKGENVQPGLRIHGTVRYLERPMPRRGWFGRRKDISAHDWLIVEKKLPQEMAQRILQRAGIAPDLKIGWMGWNERTMLALEWILSDPPDVLVLDTAGNDLVGIRRVLDRLSTRPPTLTIVYLKLIDGPCSPCICGGQCVEVCAQRTEAALVE